MKIPKPLTTLALGAAGLGGLALLNRQIASQSPSLDVSEDLPGISATFDWFGYRIAYSATGAGQPVVLVHGFGAGADSFQWRRLLPLLVPDYQVFSYDQLGFGASDRPDMNYYPDLYVHLQQYFLDRIVRQPALVVASSLAAAHSILAAADRPELVRGLVLLCPTGTLALAHPPNPIQSLVGEVLRLPILGQSLYYALTSQANIRHEVYDNLYARHDTVDADRLLPHFYASSHQPGARHAVSAFLGGRLNADVSQALLRLTQPATIVWGEQARLTPAWQARSFLDINPRIRLLTCENAGVSVESECPEVVHQAITATLRRMKEEG